MSSPRIATLVLAAGSSARFGTLDKLVVPVAGMALLSWTLATLPRSAGAERIAVVSAGSGVPARIATGFGCRVVVAHDADRGISRSIRAGLGALATGSTCDGAVIVLGDDPLAARLVDRVIAAAGCEPERPVAVRREGAAPHPVYLPRAAWPQGPSDGADHPDRGLRALLDRSDARWIDGEGFPSFDVDVPGDIAELARRLNG